MNESKKLLIGFAVVGLMCICVAGIAFFSFREFGKRVEKIAKGDPASVAKAQENIANFKIPPGYNATAMNFLMYNIVTLTPDESHRGTMIMLMQYNGLFSGNDEQMKEQLRQAVKRQSGQGSSMQVVDSFETVIREETVIVTVSEDDRMRQWMTIFQGNKGPTMLMIMGSISIWDDQLAEDFIESIQ